MDFSNPKAVLEMSDVMVDLETKGNKPGCMILSIGAVYFDPRTGHLGEQFYMVLSPMGQQTRGLHEDADTMAWWAKQDPAARAVLAEAEASEVTLQEGLDEFAKFLAKAGLKRVKVWGNGSDFDNAILTVAYMAHQQNIPWDFWNNRCFRTLKGLLPDLKMQKSLLAHNALNDAIMQAEHACKVLSALRVAGKGGAVKPITSPMLAAKTEGEGLTFPVLASPKLDGVRCLIVDGCAMSRTFKPIPNRHVQFLFGRPELNGLDGELIVGKPSDPNCFRNTTSGVMSEAGKPEVIFHVFDDFSLMAQGWGFVARLDSAFKRTALPGVQCVTHRSLTSEEQLKRYEEQCLAGGYEGVMLRAPFGPYKQGRSTAHEGFLLKLKRFEDSEAEVLGVFELMHNANEKALGTGGKMERSHKKAGMVGQGKLGALRVKDAKTGVEFDLGTGFTDAERSLLWEKRTGMAGLVVKYKFFPTGSKDKPRFPTFLGFRDPIDL